MMDNNYVRQLEAENRHLREELAKPYELLTNPTIVIDDPSGYIRKLQADYAALVQAAQEYVEAVNTPKSDSLKERAEKFAALAALLSSEPTP